MLSTSGVQCRLDTIGMAPTASWTPAKIPLNTNIINISQTKPKRIPVSILKKAESDTSSTCSNGSMVRCQRGCKVRVPNTLLNSHDCIATLRQELNDAYGKIDDLEEQLRLQTDSFKEKEGVLRSQIKRLRNNLGISNLLEVQGQKIGLELTRENGTFGFKLLGRAEEDDGEEGVVISSLTVGCPAEKSGKIYIWDKIIEINNNDVSQSTCREVERYIRNSPDTMKLVIMRTPQSTQSQPPPIPPPPPPTHNIHCPSPVYSPLLPCSLSQSVQPLPPNRSTSLAHSQPSAQHQLPQHQLPQPHLPQHQLPLPNLPHHQLPHITVHDQQCPDLNAPHNTLPNSLSSHLISDEDFDSLSAIGLLEQLDSSQEKSSEMSEFSLGRESDVTNVTDVVDIMGDSREYEEVTLKKDNGMLGITLTYGTEQLLGTLFVDSVRDNSPAHRAGKPLLHDQILKINGNEIGVDVMCDEAITLLTDNNETVTLELARPKKHIVRVNRKSGESLGMMVAVSKLEEDKSVIISTVDPNGLVGRLGLFKGLTLHKVNDTLLHGLGLKRVVEILASAVGEVTLVVFLHPNFSPYQPPRPPTPYPLGETGEGVATSYEPEDSERSVKFSLPASPARSNSTSGSIDSISCDTRTSPKLRNMSSSPKSRDDHGKKMKYRISSVDSSPSRGRSPGGSSFDYNDPRNLKPFPRGYGSPSINLINNDWSGSIDKSTDSPFRTMKLAREQTKGPIKVMHQVIPTSILPMKVSLHNNSFLSESDVPSFDHSRNTSNTASPTPHHSRISPTPHPSINAHTPNFQSFASPDYENVVRYPDYKTARDSVIRPRVLGRRERAVLSGTADRKVQFGSFKPINPNDNDDEHYV